MCRSRDKGYDDEADEWKLHSQLPLEAGCQLGTFPNDSLVTFRCYLYKVYPVEANGIPLIFHRGRANVWSTQFRDRTLVVTYRSISG